MTARINPRAIQHDVVGICCCTHGAEVHAGMGSPCQVEGCGCDLFSRGDAYGAEPPLPDFKLTARRGEERPYRIVQWTGTFEEVHRAYVENYAAVHTISLCAQDGSGPRHYRAPWVEIQIPRAWYQEALQHRQEHP